MDLSLGFGATGVEGSKEVSPEDDISDGEGDSHNEDVKGKGDDI